MIYAKNQIQLGDNLNSSKNFIIRASAIDEGVLEICQGDLDNPGNVIAKISEGAIEFLGTVKSLPAVESGDVVTFDQTFGVGQTFVDFTGNPARALDVVYTNTTGRPIVVYVRCTVGSNPSAMSVSVGSSNVNIIRNPHSSVSALGLTTIVPPGETYKAAVDGVGSGLEFWYEFR